MTVTPMISGGSLPSSRTPRVSSKGGDSFPTPSPPPSAPKAKAARPTKGAKLHALEQWTPKVVHRSQIKNADYNPRVITADAKRKLRGILKKSKLRSPPTWNERTGNIVGGHQRMNALDALSDTGADYTLTVAAIDVSPKEEREINLALNNAAAQGEFDLEKLEELIKSGIDHEAAGWDDADMHRLFGNSVANLPSDGEKSVEKALDRIMELDKSTEAAKAAAVERDREDFYMVVVFRSYVERKTFTDARGLEDSRYQSGESFGDAPPAPPTPTKKKRQAA